MLRSGVLPPDQQPKAIEAIERNAASLSQLVNDLLDTSRIITGKLRLDVRTCDITQVINAAIESLGPALESKQITFDCDCPDGLTLSGDPDRLQQVFWNLLANATRFTPPGGHIQLRAREIGSSIEVTVTDTGIGISAEAIPLLFQRFWQAESVQSREHGGLGLGLALARHFIELHGGHISASSPGLGHGATFRVVLPVRGEQGETVPNDAEGWEGWA
jgi:signal transduction histidine kinase